MNNQRAMAAQMYLNSGLSKPKGRISKPKRKPEGKDFNYPSKNQYGLCQKCLMGKWIFMNTTILIFMGLFLNLLQPCVCIHNQGEM